MFTERTSVGLDVHARSVAAAAIDGVTGELVQAKLTPSREHIRSWLEGLPGPVAVTYEAGPTGFGLHRYLARAGIRCEVAAPSKLQKPSGDRVKTDAKDAVHLARLLRLVCVFVSVLLATASQQQNQTIVRAARVLDPASGRYSGPSTVVVRNGTIVSVDAAAPSAVRPSDVIDVGTLTLMPGLIDGHVHLLANAGAGQKDVHLWNVLTFIEEQTLHAAAATNAWARVHLDQLANFGQRQAMHLGLLDEPQPRHGLRVVDAESPVRPPGGCNHADAFVVAQRIRGHAGARGELADRERGIRRHRPLPR